ncbi:TPA: fimbria/pilus periplasmic chaperone [Klebsiella oxytoca]
MKLKKIRCILLILFIIYQSSLASEANSIVYPFPTDTEVNIFTIRDEVNQGILQITNPGERTWLVQSWTEDEECRKGSTVYPHIARIEPKSDLVLKVYPQLKKGKMWVVVMFIPSNDISTRSQLTIPVAYRLKINMPSTSS